MQTMMESTLSLPKSRLPLERFRKWLGGSYAPYLFVLPFFLMFFAFGLYPLLYALTLSFTRWHGAGAPQFIGLANYIFLLQDHAFWNSLGNSVVMWLLVVPIQILLSIVVASTLSRPIRLRSFFRTIFLIPYLVPLVAIAQVWLIIFNRDFGIANALLSGLNFGHIGWLTTVQWSKPTMALLVFWKGFGFSILIMLAAIQNIPLDLYESAELDGATGLAKFWYVTIPLMRRTIAFFMVIATLGILQMFAEPYVLTNGGPINSTTTAGFALLSYIRGLDLGTGAAHSFLLMILVMVIALAMLKLMRAGEEF
jgi:ABC-type sugar transport system permease subunit